MKARLSLILLFVCCLALALRADDAVVEAEISASDRVHWAFQPIKRPALPPVKQSPWLRTSVDPFILARLEKPILAAGNLHCGLQPQLKPIDRGRHLAREIAIFNTR